MSDLEEIEYISVTTHTTLNVMSTDSLSSAKELANQIGLMIIGISTDLE